MVRTTDVGFIRPLKSFLHVSSTVRDTICALPRPRRSHDATKAKVELFSAIVACLEPGAESDRAVETSHCGSQYQVEVHRSPVGQGRWSAQRRARSIQGLPYNWKDERQCLDGRGHVTPLVTKSSLASCSQQRQLHAGEHLRGRATMEHPAKLRKRPQPQTLMPGFASTVVSRISMAPAEEISTSKPFGASRPFNLVPEYHEVFRKRMGRGPKARRQAPSWAEESVEDISEIVAAIPATKQKVILEVPQREHQPLGNYCPLSPILVTSRRSCLQEESTDLLDESARIEQTESRHSLDPLTVLSNSVESVGSHGEKELVTASIVEAASQLEQLPRGVRCSTPTNAQLEWTNICGVVQDERAIQNDQSLSKRRPSEHVNTKSSEAIQRQESPSSPLSPSSRNRNLPTPASSEDSLQEDSQRSL